MDLSRRRFATLAGGSLSAGLLAAGAPAGSAVAAPGVSPAAAGGPPPGSGGSGHTVTFDPYSLIVDGRRVVLWSGEFHPFRLPSPALWRDVLQKFRANGYNTVCVYIAWNYHSPAPGAYDFTGVRDLDLFLRMAAETGLYVTVRPGPYINAEVDAGGYPGWLTATAGQARTDDPTYLGHVDEWLTAVNAIIARHQYTRGQGTVLLYQLENEYAAHLTDGTGAAYLAHLYAKVRADGIEVPLFHNDKGRNGYWVPGSFPTGGESGRYLYAFDGYPSPAGNPPDWGCFGPGGAKGGSTASPGTPGFLAEFGGGWFDPWGGAEFGGLGYAESRRTRDAAYERRFYLTNLANGIRLHNVYMTFGGTSWGWLPAPVVYTSYDYGAAIDESRGQTSKLVPMKQIGEMLRSFPGLAALDRAADTSASDPAVRVYHLTGHPTGHPTGAGTGSHVYLLRNDTTSDISCTLPVGTAAGPLTVPAAQGGLRVAAKDMKLLATDIPAGQRSLRYTTAQPMLALSAGRQDVVLLIGRPGDPVETAVECPVKPSATVLDGSATTSYDSAAGLLRINGVLSGLTRVLVEGGGSGTPLLLLLADDDASAALWRHDTAAGPVLVRGPSLLRAARALGPEVMLEGDTAEACELEVWGPRGTALLRWNGEAVPAAPTASGSLLARHPLPGAPRVELPALTGWRRLDGNPESGPAFDDSAWTIADKSTSYSTTPVPAGQPVLFADDYGFHYGDVWYRGHYQGGDGVGTISLSYSSGTQGLLMAWLDGTALGVHRQPVPTKAEDTRGTWAATATFPVPAALRGPGEHVLSVLVRPMAHDEDGGARDTHKAARGLTTAAFGPSAATAPALTWRIQGGSPDPVRGPLNNGGLHGERTGMHLPGFPDGDWQRVALPHAETRQGVSWYRTTFDLAVPRDVDASIGLTLDDDPSRAYRVQIFVNGWNLGQYINDVGPQHTFVLPNGILLPRGRNTLALAVLADGTTPAGPAEVALTLLGAVRGGVPLAPVASPGYRPARR